MKKLQRRSQRSNVYFRQIFPLIISIFIMFQNGDVIIVYLTFVFDIKLFIHLCQNRDFLFNQTLFSRLIELEFHCLHNSDIRIMLVQTKISNLNLPKFIKLIILFCFILSKNSFLYTLFDRRIDLSTVQKVGRRFYT